MRSFIESSVTFGIVISIIGYEAGLFLRRKFNYAAVNPILISMLFVITFLSVAEIDYKHYENGAKYITYLLTPTTVSLAIPLYKNLMVLKKNFVAIIMGITAGIFANIVCLFSFAVLFKMEHREYVTLLPKSITTAIGMGVSEENGGIVAITIALIVITGVFGNITAVAVCKLFKIINPVAKGVAIGTSAHALGVSRAMEIGEVEGSIAGVAMVVCGILTLIAVPMFSGLI